MTGDFTIDFHSSDSFSVEYERLYELLVDPFEISDGVSIAPGGYGFDNVAVSYTFGPQYRLSGRRRSKPAVSMTATGRHSVSVDALS